MRHMLGLIVTISTLFASALLHAGTPAQERQAGGHRTMIAIPQSIQAEHKAIHDALTEATKAPGRVGAAARELAAVLGPHFKREDEIALPPLGLLASLAAGEKPDGMKEALEMSDALRKEMPQMLEEHTHIRAATEKLRTVSREENASAHAEFAEQLAAHATSEEEVLYPAAILVGDIIRMRMAK